MPLDNQGASGTTQGDDVTHQIRPGAAGLGPLTEAAWRKATASDANSGCVEVAFLANGRVGVRDSKNRAKPPLMVTAQEWARFITGARSGDFDLPS
jgi:Domain of unknown function (DUF397)